MKLPTNKILVVLAATVLSSLNAFAADQKKIYDQYVCKSISTERIIEVHVLFLNPQYANKIPKAVNVFADNNPVFTSKGVSMHQTSANYIDYYANDKNAYLSLDLQVDNGQAYLHIRNSDADSFQVSRLEMLCELQ